MYTFKGNILLCCSLSTFPWQLCIYVLPAPGSRGRIFLFFTEQFPLAIFWSVLPQGPFLCRLILSIPECYINGSTYVLFCLIIPPLAWCFWDSSTLFCLSVACILLILIFLAQQSSSVFIDHSLFARSPADRHFSCFWCLVITNATGENTLVQVFCVTHVFTSLGSVPVAGSQAWWIFKIKCCVLKQQQQQSEKETLLEFLELLCLSEWSTASFSLFFPLAWDLSDWWERGISPLALHVTAQLSRSFCERLCFCEYWGAPKGRIMYSEWTLT